MSHLILSADSAGPVVHRERRRVLVYAVDVVDGSAGVTAEEVPRLMAGAAVVVIPHLPLTHQLLPDA